MSKLLHCNFCNKDQAEVKLLIAAPKIKCTCNQVHSVLICNECIVSCVETLSKKLNKEK